MTRRWSWSKSRLDARSLSREEKREKEKGGKGAYRKKMEEREESGRRSGTN